MEDNIIVSIGMPVFNAEKHLRHAINSILNQSFKKLELIISDDGSTDSSREIIQSYSDSRIILIGETINRGIGYRLNEQIGIARGLYFARMDSDDIMFPDRILNQLQYLNSHPDVDVLGGAAVVINEEQQITGLRKINQHYKADAIFENSLFIHPTVMGKTNWFRQHMYDNTYSGTEDHELFMRAYQQSNYSNLEYPVLFYRDSAQLNLPSYLDRQQELIRGLDKNAHLINNQHKLRILKMKIHLRSILFRVMNSLNLDSLLIKRRNQTIEANQLAIFNTILHKLIQQ